MLSAGKAFQLAADSRIENATFQNLLKKSSLYLKVSAISCINIICNERSEILSFFKFSEFFDYVKLIRKFASDSERNQQHGFASRNRFSGAQCLSNHTQEISETSIDKKRIFLNLL